MGFQSYKWNTARILNTLKWPNIYHLIIAESLKLIHRPVFETFPPAITSMFSNFDDINKITRKLYLPKLKVKPKSEYLAKSIMHCSVHLYRLIPEHYRSMNPKKFGKNIGEYLRINWDPHNIPH